MAVQACGRRTRGLLIAGLVAFLAIVLAAPADAHVKTSTGYSVIHSDGNQVNYELRVEYDVLAKSSAMGGAAEDATENEARLAALRDKYDVVADYLGDRVDIYLDDVACEGSLAKADVRTENSLTYAVLDLKFSCPGSPNGSYRVHYGVFALTEGIIDDHVNLVDYDLGGRKGQAAFNSSDTDFVAGDRSILAWAGRFVMLGVEHILSGLDHVLFVVALLLGASSLRSLAKVVTMFTLAHSLTLGLAVLGWVNVPAEIVEPLIALSIVYVAVENVLGGGRSRHRPVVVFMFGLLHGLGFASALKFDDHLGWGLVGSLAGINVGIEIGQALLVLVLFPLLLGLRRLPSIRRLSPATVLHVGATGVIACLGLVWFAQRVSLG